MTSLFTALLRIAALLTGIAVVSGSVTMGKSQFPICL